MRRGIAGMISLFALVTALVCGVFGALAVNSLTDGPAGTDIVTAAGPQGIDRAPVAAESAVTVPAYAGAAGGPAPGPVTVLTPDRNPPLMAQGADGEDVRELQARLAHLGLFDADVTGYFGAVTAGAVRSYQESTALAVTGEIYPDLWAVLQAETPAPTEEQLYPPPPPPPPEVAPPVAEPVAEPVTSLDARCTTGRVMCIDKTDQVLRWVVDGRVLLEMDARFGRESLPTDEGHFSVFWKSRDHVSSIYEADMPFAMFFSGGQAVHFSGEFLAQGYSGAGSHGCVNIRDYDGIEWLFDQVRTGDDVVVYWS